MSADVRVIADPGTWMESAAVDQLRAVAALPGMRRVVGMPDLHPGKGCPVGAACLADVIVYPHLVGNDIGCGMGLWATDQPVHRLKLDRLEKALDIDEPFAGDASELLVAEGAEGQRFAPSLGTIGGGNHFAELQRVSEVRAHERLAQLGIDAKNLVLMVHSGSRGLGEAILRKHTDRYAAAGLPAASSEGAAYLREHDAAVGWARANRRVIAARVLDAVGCAGERVLDICHNSVTPFPTAGTNAWLHRKGAAPADRGAVVIPGSRGDHSYLVDPLGDGELNLSSLAHGAGRKWQRSAAKGKLGAKADAARLRRTKLGSRVICEDKELLFEEAPEAYKPIEQVVGSLERAGVARVLAVLTPVLTYKTRRR